MKRVLGYWIAVLLWASFMTLSGCAYFSKAASVQSAVASDGAPEQAGRVAVPAFIQEKYKGGHGTERWPDAAVTDRFATGLLQRGYTLVDRAVVQKTLKDNGLTWKDIHREEIVSKIGQLLKADVVVLGTLSMVEQADGTILSRKVNVRGIRVSDGQVVFSMSAVDTTMYRVLSGEDLVDQGLADMFAVSEEEDGEEAPKKSAAASASGNISASATLGGETEASAESSEQPESVEDDVTDEGEIDPRFVAEDPVEEPSETEPPALEEVATPDGETAIPDEEASETSDEATTD